MNDKPTNTQLPHRRLHFWVAGSIALAALVFTSLTAVYTYFETYKQELRTTEKTLAQLAATVENTAAIAAYLDNRELALDVIGGLAKNDIVAAAAIVSHTDTQVKTGIFDPLDGPGVYSFPLTSPFSPDEVVGKILIKSREQLIEDQARSAAFDHIQLLSIHTLIITLLVMLLVDRVLTRPLTRLAADLHKIAPGSDETLTCPRWHTKDEIGGLVNDTNQLLLSVRTRLDIERKLRSRIEAMEQHFRLIFERASAGIFLMDQQGTLLLSNHAFDQLVGVQQAQRMRNTRQPKVIDLFSNGEELRATIEQVCQEDIAEALDLELKATDEHQSGWLHCLFSSVIDDKGTLIIEGLMSDITERANREKLIKFDAEHDPLTHLLNRRSGENQLNKAMKLSAKGEGISFALLLLDLDHFKPINDELGHEVGDQVLVEVAKRLRDSVRGDDIVIRWGGDEFVLGLLKGHGPLNPAPVVKKLLREIGREIILDDDEPVRVGTSIGMAYYPIHGEDLDLLISKADQAMYEVKQSGRNGFRVYEEKNNSIADDKHQESSKTHRATASH